MIRKSFFLTLLLAILLSSIDVWSATAPSADAKYISFRSVGQTSASIKWVKGSGGTGTRLMSAVYVRATSAVADAPADADDLSTVDEASSPNYGTGPMDGTSRVVYYGTGNSITLSGLTAGTTYEVKIYTARDDGSYLSSKYFTYGGASQNPRSFTTLDAAIGAPSSLALTSINTGGFAVSWSAGTNADGYVTNLAKNSAFTSFTGECADYQEADLGNTTSFEFDGLTQNSSYYWNVYAYNNSGTSTIINYLSNNADGRVAPLANYATNPTSISASIVPNEAANNTRLALSWAGGAASGSGTLKYLVVGEAGASITDTPTDGKSYTGDTVFTAATAIATTSKILYYGTGTSATITSLTADNQYTFKVYTVQTNGFNNNENFADRTYNTSPASVSRYTLAAEQANQASVPVFSTLISGPAGYTLSWTAATTGTTLKYAVVAKAGSSAGTSIPTDGTAITNLAGDFTAVGDATTNLADGKVVYFGTANTIAITNLSAKTQYTFAIYAANEGTGGATTINYKTVSPLTATRYTLATAPITQATAAAAVISFSGGEGEIGKLNVTWTAGAIDNANTLGYLILGRDNNATVTQAPANGQTYTADNNYLGTPASISGDFVVYKGTANSATISGLTNAATADFDVIAYSWDGTNAETVNYGTASAFTPRYTLTTQVGAATSIAMANQAVNSMDISWTTNGTGHTGDILVSRLGLVGATTAPTDGLLVGAPADANAGNANAALGANGETLARQANGLVPVSVVGLTSGNPYVYQVYTYNTTNNNADVNYNATTPASATFFTLSDPLVTDPSAPVFTNLDTTAYTLSWTAPTTVTDNTTRFLVVAKLGATPTVVPPLDGVYNYTGTVNSLVNYDWVAQATIDYTPDPTYRVVYDGTGTTINFSKLVKMNQYSFTIWAYTTKTDVTTGMTNTKCNYNFNTNQITATRFTIAGAQTVATALAPTVATPTTLKQLSFTWTDGVAYPGFTPGYIGIVYPTGAATDPTKGSNYSTGVNANYTTATATTGGGNKVVYNADGDNSGTDNVTVTGLTSDDTQYTFDVYAYNYSGTAADGTQNYNVASKGTVSRYTLGAAATQPAAISITYDGTYKRINLTSNGTVNNLITLTKTTDVEATPLKGIDALNTTLASNPVSFSGATGLTNASLSTVTKVLAYYNGSNPVTQVSDLTPNTQYTASAYEFGGTIGHNSANYSTVITTNFYSIASEPTSQAGGVSIGTRTVDGFTINWTQGAFTGTSDGATLKTLVTVQATNGTVLAPSDGTQYTPQTNFTGSLLGTTGANERVVYASTGTSVAVTGLATNTNYIVRVYAYREGTDIYTANYLGTPATATAYTLSPEPNGVTGHPTATTLGVTANTLGQIDVSGIVYNGTGANSTLISIVKTADVGSIGAPVDGTYYALTNTTQSATGNSNTVGSSTFTWLNTVGATQSITNLENNTQYNVYAYGAQRTTDNTDINYLTSLTPTPTQRYTLATAPTGTPGTPSFSVLTNVSANPGTSGYTVSWVNSGTDPNVIVVLAPTVTAPSDGTSYLPVSGAVDYSTPTDVTAAGSVILFNGAQTGTGLTQTVAVTGLAPNTSYTAIAYYYTGTRGTGAENYGTASGSGTRYTLSNEASVQPATLTASAVTVGGLNLAWTAGAGESSTSNNGDAINYIVTIQPAAGTPVAPTDGTDYTAALNYSTGSSSTLGTTGGNEVVAYVGTGNGPISITGLSANTEYTVRAYEYRAGGAGSANYFATARTATVYTLVNEPTTQATLANPTVQTDNTGRISLSWSGAVAAASNGGTLGYLVTANIAAPLTDPTDGTTLTATNTIYDAAPADMLGAAEIVYTGTGTLANITGLSPNTRYYFKLFTYASGGQTSQINYKTDVTSSKDRYTLDIVPNAPSAVTFATLVNDGSTKTMDVSWTSGAAQSDYTLVVATLDGTTPAIPSDGNAYTAVTGAVNVSTSSNSISGTTLILYNGVTATTSVSLTAVPASALVNVVAYHYNGVTGTGAENYGTSVTNNRYFLANPRTVVAPYTGVPTPTLTSGNATLGQMTYTWTAATADQIKGYLLVVRNDGSDLSANPSNGTAYTASAAYGSGDAIGGGTVVYNGTSLTQTITALNNATLLSARLYSYNWDGTHAETINYSTASERLIATADMTPAAPAADDVTTFTASQDLVGNNNTDGKLNLAWNGTAGANHSYLIVARNGGAPSTGIPQDGTGYTANTDYSLAATLGDSKIVYAGTAQSVSLTNLTGGANFFFDIYKTNANTTFVTPDNAMSRNYTLVASTSTFTPSTEPTNQPTALTFTVLGQGNAAASTGYTVGWTASVGGATGYLVIAKAGGTAPADLPTDATLLTATDADFNTPQVITTGGEQIVYRSTTNSVAVTGLDPQTQYSFAVYAYNYDGTNPTTINYKTGSPLATPARYTLSATPTAASAGTQTSVTPTGLTVNWTNGTNTRVLVFMRTGSSALLTPTLTNGTTHTGAYPSAVANAVNAEAATAAGQLIYSGVGTNVPLTNLTPGVVYSIMVVSVKEDGSNAETYRYTTSGTTLASYQFNVNTAAQEPTAITAGVAFSNVTTTTADVTLTVPGSGGGTKRLVTIKQAAAGVAFGTPSDVTTYTAASAGDITTGTNIAPTTYVIKTGAATTVSLSGLTAGTKYTVRSYEYNDDGTPGMENYLNSTASVPSYEVYGTNVKELNTLATAPLTQATAISFTNASHNGTTSSYNVGWTAPGSGVHENYLVVRKQGSAPSFAPTNSSSYTTSTDISGTNAGESIVYVGTSTNFTMSGMTAGADNYFRIYVFNDNTNPGSENYYPTAATSHQKSVTTNPKVFSGAAITANTTTDNTINIKWDNATGAGTTPTGYIVIVTNTIAHSVYPLDATNYATNLTYSTAGTLALTTHKVVYRGANPGIGGITVAGLTSGNTYNFRVYSYNDETDDATINYTDGTGVSGTDFLALTVTTLADKPSAAASTLAAGTRTTLAIPLTWATNAGASNVLVLRSTTNVGFTQPVQGTEYVTGGSFGGAYVVYSGTTKTSDPNATGLSANTQYFYKVYNYNVNGANTANYDVSGSTAGVGDDDCATANAWTLNEEPTTNGAITLTTISGSEIDIKWTASTGGASGTRKYLVVAKATGLTSYVPTDGAAVVDPGNTIFGGTAAGDGQLLYSGELPVGFPATPLHITGLAGTTDYYFSVYTSLVGSDASTENFYATPLTGNISTLSDQPTGQAPAVTLGVTADVTDRLDISGITYAATGSNRTLLTVTPTASIGSAGDPVDGTAYTTNSTYTGTALNSSKVTWFGPSGDGATQTLTGLTPNTQYTVRAYSAKRTNVDGDINYLQTSPNTTTRYTLATAPVTTGVTPTFGTLTNDGSTSGFTVNWTNSGSDANVIVVLKASTDPTGPVDGTSYAAVTSTVNFSSPTASTASGVVIFNGAQTGNGIAQSAVVTNLAANTQYNAIVYYYTGTTGTGAENYGTAGTAGTKVTLANNPTTQPTAVTLGVTANTPGELNITGIVYDGTGSDRTLLTVTPTAGTTGDPVDAASYSTNANFITATALTGDSKVTFIDATAGATTQTVTNLTAGAQYTVRAYAGKTNSDGLINFLQATPSVTTRYTLASAPATTGVTPTIGTLTNNGTTSGFTVNWTNSGSDDNVMVILKAGATPAAPSDGSTYAAVSGSVDFSAGTVTTAANSVVIFNGARSGASQSAVVTNLTANTSYTAIVYYYMGTVGTGSANFGTAGTTASTTTLANPPSAATLVKIARSTRTTTGMTVTWTDNSAGAARYLVLANTVNTFTDPSGATDYSAGASTDYQAAATALGAKVVYDGVNATSVAVTNIPTASSGQAMFFRVYAYAGTGGGQSYAASTNGTHTTLGSQPALATGLTTSSNAGGTVGITWTTAATTTNDLVLLKAAASVTDAPTVGNTYVASDVIGTSSATYTNETDGATSRSTSILGLIPGTQYTVKVFNYEGADYNAGDSFTGGADGTTNQGSQNYNAGTAGVTFIARSAQPTGTYGTLTASNVASTQFELAYASAVSGLTGATKYLVLASTVAITTPPVDGTTFSSYSTAFGTHTSLLFNGGTTSIIYNGISTDPITITSLSAGLTYYIAVYAYADASSVAGSENYMATAATLTQGTLAAEPTTNSVFGTATMKGSTASLAYTGGDGDGKIVFYRADGTPTFVPVDGTTYVNGTTYGDSKAYNVTNSSPAVVAGLSPLTTYTFALYNYKGSSNGTNYKTDALPTAIPIVTGTTGAAPVPTSLAITSGTVSPLTYVTGTSYTIGTQINDQYGDAVGANNSQGTIALAIGGTSTTLTSMATVVGQSAYTLPSVDFSTYNSGLGGTGLTLSATCGSFTTPLAEQTGITLMASAPDHAASISTWVTYSPTSMQWTFSGYAGTLNNTGLAVVVRKSSTKLVNTDLTGLVIDGSAPTAVTFNDGLSTVQIIHVGETNTGIVSSLTTGKFSLGAIPYRGITGSPTTYNWGTSSQTISSTPKSLKRGQTGGNTDPDYSDDGSGFDMSSIINNPVVDKIEFDLFNYADGVYNVQITNLKGDVVATGYNNALFTKGTHRISIPLSSNIAAGSYYIMVNNGMDMQIESFIVMP